MKKTFTFLLLLAYILFSVTSAQAQKETLSSPDGKLVVKAKLWLGPTFFSIEDENGMIINNLRVGMEADQGKINWDGGKHLKKIVRKSVHQEVSSPLYRKSSITEDYNEMTLVFDNHWKLVFRAYNSGIAYRFESSFQDSIKVISETVDFQFPDNWPAYVPYVSVDRKEGEPYDKLFETSFENLYTHFSTLSEMDENRLAFLPLLLELPKNRKVVITEADLRDYPGMYLRHPEDRSLIGVFAPLPKKWEQGGHNNLQYVVKEREDYIAKTAGTRSFPWRVIAIAKEDKELVDNDLVYLLAEPSKVADISWIKPGKVAWDWWNNWNIWGVDFKAGINNETYKYYIDFAAEKGIEYVILDEGWAVNKKADLFQIVPEIDLPMLVKYAESKGVGIVLWAGYAAMDKEMERVCQHYSEMGVKGFKVDFMDRDDQIVVNFYERMAATAAKYHLFIDFHGAYKPTGLSRTYPNVLNYEGVFGLEQCKWADSKTDMVTYEVTIPFIRMLAGPMDFTQGAMRNGAKWCYFPSWNEPMSQGTRCRQLAEYVIFDAPFAMLCDAPTAYLQEPECTEFIATVPTVWDETRILDGQVGDFVISAKRKGDTWYIGALTDWERRTFDIDLKALGITSGTVTMFIDGPNAHRKGVDYQKKTIAVPANGIITVALAPGGGAALIIK